MPIPKIEPSNTTAHFRGKHEPCRTSIQFTQTYQPPSI